MDRFIERYRVATGSSVPLQKNVFDYGVHFEAYDLVPYNFGDEQRRARKFREGTVRLMCDGREHGSPISGLLSMSVLCGSKCIKSHATHHSDHFIALDV